MHSTSRLKYISAFSCDVETIWGKSITIGLSSSVKRMLNSLKSEWMRPHCARLTMRFIRLEYSLPGSSTSCTCVLENKNK